MKVRKRLRLAAILVLFCAGCSRTESTIKPSDDGKTYLQVNASACEIEVDDEPWPHKSGEKGLIEPGHHRINCNADRDIDIDSGVVYSLTFVSEK